MSRELPTKISWPDYDWQKQVDELHHLLDGKSEEYERAMHRISQMEAAYTELRSKLLFEVGFMPPPVADSVCTALADFKDVFILANAEVSNGGTPFGSPSC